MANLISRLHSQHVETDGAELKLAPGRHGIRCHVPVSVFTDDHEIAIEANVDAEFDTISGEVRIYRRHAPVAIELWPVVAQPAVDPVMGLEGPAAVSTPPADEASPDK